MCCCPISSELLGETGGKKCAEHLGRIFVHSVHSDGRQVTHVRPRTASEMWG